MKKVLLLLLLVSSCSSRAPIKATPPFSNQQTTGEGWQARFEADGTITLFAANAQALQTAVDELCNQPKLICTAPVPTGRVFLLQRYSK